MASNLAQATADVNRLSELVDFFNKIVLGDADMDATIDGETRPVLAKLAASFLLGMDTYATVADGLAGAGEGGFFQVVSDVDEEYTILYQDVNGVAVEKKRYPSYQMVDLIFLARDQAEAAATSAGLDANQAAASASTASTARDQSVAASEASGDVQFFDSKALADAATLSEGDIVEVFSDESRNGAVSRYRYESGALVFKWQPGQRYVTAEGTTDTRTQQEWAAQTLEPDSSEVTAAGTADQRTLADWMKALGYPATATGEQALVDALNQRMPRTTSVAALGALLLPAGASIYLEQGGRSGVFAIKAGTPPSDPQKGIYVPLTNGNYAERVFSGAAIPLWFGAMGDGVTDDALAIQATVDFVESESQVSTYPYRIRDIWFPSGTYIVGSPIQFTQACSVDGDSANIRGIGAAYQGKTIPSASGGTEENKAIFLFLNGSKHDNSGSGVVRHSAKVGSGIAIHCREFAFPGIYIERMPYSQINCEVNSSSTNGLEVGPDMWGLNLDGIIVENATLSGVYFHVDAACNGMSIRNPKLWGEFKTSYSGLNFADGSQCNGVTIDGGFIEKVDYGVLVGKTSGPIDVTGVDFEFCTYNCVRAVGDSNDPRDVGPVSVNNCFLHSVNNARLYADSATITAEDCRVFGAGYTAQTDLTYLGAVVLDNCTFDVGFDFFPGSNVTLKTVRGTGRTSTNYTSHKLPQFTVADELANYQYRDSPFLKSSGLSFSSSYIGGAGGTYVSRSDWFITQYDHVSNPGTASKTIGVRLSNAAQQNAVQPLLDNTTALGNSNARWSVVYSAVGTINTSDEREKEQQRQLTEAERRIAIALKGEIKAFKWKHAVGDKGDGARWHFGVMAQKVAELFQAEGLDAHEYGLFCYDQWDEVPEVKDEDGKVTTEYQASGDRYGVRYDELLAFIVSQL